MIENKELKEFIKVNKLNLPKIITNLGNIDDNESTINILSNKIDEYRSTNLESLQNNEELKKRLKNSELLFEILDESYIFNSLLEDGEVNTINIINILLDEEEVLCNKSKQQKNELSALSIYKNEMKGVLDKLTKTLLNDNIEDYTNKLGIISECEDNLVKLRERVLETYCLSTEDFKQVEETFTTIIKTLKDTLSNIKTSNIDEENNVKELENEIEKLKIEKDQLENNLNLLKEDTNKTINELMATNQQLDSGSSNNTIDNDNNNNNKSLIEEVKSIVKDSYTLQDNISTKIDKLTDNDDLVLLKDDISLIKNMLTSNISISVDTNNKIAASKILKFGNVENKSNVIEVPNSDYILVKRY